MTTPLDPNDREARLARLAARRAAQHGPIASASPWPPPGAPGRAAPPARRRHTARGSRAAALALSVGATVGLAAYLEAIEASGSLASPSDVTDATGTASATTAASAEPAVAEASESDSSDDAALAPDNAATATTDAASTVAPATTAALASSLADGTYAGDALTNRWGVVQVQITVSGGTITAVDVLQYPDGDHKSVEINQRALPTLIEATLAAQSADVDTVSGATYTSDGYQGSLQSAIDAARAAATT